MIVVSSYKFALLSLLSRALGSKTENTVFTQKLRCKISLRPFQNSFQKTNVNIENQRPGFYETTLYQYLFSGNKATIYRQTFVEATGPNATSPFKIK